MRAESWMKILTTGTEVKISVLKDVEFRDIAVSKVVGYPKPQAQYIVGADTNSPLWMR